MVTTESVTIKVPVGMSKYLVTMNPETELTRNALLLYPYILNQTISHGRAAEILGIRKSELIDLYDKLGYSYFDMTMDDLDDMIIGTLNTIDPLLDPAGICDQECIRYLKGITPEDIARIRREILDTTNQELGGLVGVIREYIETGKFCAVGDVK